MKQSVRFVIMRDNSVITDKKKIALMHFMLEEKIELSQDLVLIQRLYG